MEVERIRTQILLALNKNANQVTDKAMFGFQTSPLIQAQSD